MHGIAFDTESFQRSDKKGTGVKLRYSTIFPKAANGVKLPISLLFLTILA